ncbi:AbrB/MazE/SpoVT family DNA-binding domain-containing protein [Rubritalea profundi]|nr:AbrB/MazE/SpoVT family DNA-binding domain-containing protein [Rubritalea profundi]
MAMTAKVTKVGNSSALILPKELMAKLNLEQGDSVSLTEVAAGVVISPYDRQKERQLEIAKKVMRENRNMLKKLAE